MATKNSRISWTDRTVIEREYNAGRSYRQISKETGFAVSSIHAEVKRGLYEHMGAETSKRPWRYSAQIAENKSDFAATNRGTAIKLGKRYDYASYIAHKILLGLSPDVIVGQLRRRGEWTVSTSTLYRYIDCGYIPGVTNKNLWMKPRRKRTYKRVQKATRPPKGTSIERRPDEINTRQEPGHWEMDSVIGTSKGKKQSLLVLTERITRYEIIIRVPGKTARATVQALDRLTRKYPPGTFKSITVDNGSEFQDCHRMEHDRHGSKRLDVYYCHPFSSWERGGNENANRIIRRFLPKGKSLDKCTQRQCKSIQDYMNNLPRKILGYATSQELFDQFIATLQPTP